MKHIGWCLEKIQIVMGYIPKAVESQDDKDKATKILDDVQEYADTLSELIIHPKFKNSLRTLENSSIPEIKLQGREIENLFKDLEHMLYVTDLYIKSLREIISGNPAQWSRKADQLVLMIDQKFGGEMGELRREFQVAVHAEEELKNLIPSEKHLEKFLKF